MQPSDLKALYYITHKDNLESILKLGILSHQQIEQQKIAKKKIYSEEVITLRKEKLVENNLSRFEDYANFYIQPRNPMLYRLLHDSGQGSFNQGTSDIVILELKKEILGHEGTYLTDGNAASQATNFYANKKKGFLKINKFILQNAAWWNNLEDGKRKIMAELLVPKKVEPHYISAIYTANSDLQKNLQEKLQKNPQKNQAKPEIILDKTKFFLPNQTYRITEKIKLIQGDMFFSSAQTLTISVNTVGVMGKGLASRTRYQFPDVFVQYQDLCRQKKLVMGRPYLIKREKSLDDVLAYDSDNLKNKNSYKWFLLFPTKKHWRENSPLQGIEQGLRWLLANYKKEGIESLALPALGCGLGALNWNQVGPSMCKFLNQMDIQSRVYLPMEQKINFENLTADFLIN